MVIVKLYNNITNLIDPMCISVMAGRHEFILHLLAVCVSSLIVFPRF